MINYNDANGTLGYSVSGTAGLFFNICGFMLIFTYYPASGIYITTTANEHVQNAKKIL